MQAPTPYNADLKILPQANCLGCTDCKGLCRDVLEMARVPETVLHRSASHT